MFIRAADWAHGREFGCRVGMDLRRILGELTGPPRVGACTLEGSVPLPDCAEIREVTVTWPGLSLGIDAAVLVHPAPLPPEVRARIHTASPLVVVVAELDRSSWEFVLARVKEQLIEVRLRLLAVQLRLLAARHPVVASELAGIAREAEPRRPRIAVIGPDSDACAQVAAAARGVDVVDHSDVDAVLAVAPSAGWGPDDVPTLIDAARRSGRLISTAALPPGVDGTVAAPGDLAQALARPRAGVVPAPRIGAWQRAAEHCERRRRLLFDAHLVALIAQAESDPAAVLRGLRAVALSNSLPEPGKPRLGSLALQAVVLGLATGAAICRVLWWWQPVLGIVLGLGAGVAVGWVRWVRGRREAQVLWAEREAARLRRATALGAAQRDGPQQWLHRKLTLARD
ncbi:hypothetical protein [Corynebacterium atrinae]|uniref:hypothetical protein n=1 Tax=Corynebacterium atrinae TaxID=1336740 RepID=UPI0025B54D5A|nr:hypothetical protein [Corynebacterium atrinae]